MKLPLALGILTSILTLTISAVASPSVPSSGIDSVVFLGQTYCVQMPWCPNFAFYGPITTPTGYVELTTSAGDPTAYLWVDRQGSMTFEANPLNFPPPPGLPLLGQLVDDGTLQEIDQFFPAGRSRPLFMQAATDDGLVSQPAVPEPSTLLLLASAAGLAYSRGRRFLQR